MRRQMPVGSTDAALGVDVLFPTPVLPRLSPIGNVEPQVHWFSQVTRPEAERARDAINRLYANSSMRQDENFRKRITSEVDFDHLTALGELVVDAKLQASGRVIHYEEGGRGPDFRIYHEGRCVAAIEVVSMFLRQDWSEDQLRWGRIADEINQRIPLTTHFVGFEVRRHRGNPPVKAICAFVRAEIARLQAGDAPVPDRFGSHKTRFVSVDDAVAIDFSFVPRRKQAPPRPTDRIVGLGQNDGGLC